MEIESVATVLISLLLVFVNIEMSQCRMWYPHTQTFPVPVPIVDQQTPTSTAEIFRMRFIAAAMRNAGDNTDHTLHNSLTTCRRPLAAAVPTTEWKLLKRPHRCDAIFAHTRNLVPVFAFTVTDETLESAAAHTNVVYHAQNKYAAHTHTYQRHLLRIKYCMRCA